MKSERTDSQGGKRFAWCAVLVVGVFATSLASAPSASKVTPTKTSSQQLAEAYAELEAAYHQLAASSEDNCQGKKPSSKELQRTIEKQQDLLKKQQKLLEEEQDKRLKATKDLEAAKKRESTFEKQLEEQRKKLLQECQEEKKKATDALAKKQLALLQENKKLAEASTLLQEGRKKLVAEIETLTARLDKQSAENEKLVETNTLLSKQLAEKETANTALAKEKARLETQLKSSQSTQKNSQQKLAALQKENTTLKAQGVKEELPRPSVVTPVANVVGTDRSANRYQGYVVQLDSINGLAVVNVGTQDGLRVGNVLEIFRGAHNTSAIATLELLRVDRVQAVGRFRTRTAVPVHRGDCVRTMPAR